MDPMLVEVRNAGYTEVSVTHMLPTSGRAGFVKNEVKFMDPKLFKAATSGHVNLLDQLTEDNLDILLQVTPIKDTALHIAARLGHYEFSRGVYSRCPSLLTKSNSKGDTPLIVAARAGHLQVVSFLINCAKNSMGASTSRDVEVGRSEAHEIVRKGNEENNTAMHEAVRNCHLEVVKLLMREDPEPLSSINYAEESPLYLAVEKSALDIIKEILRMDRYSHRGPNGRTALHAASVLQDTVITKMLLNEKQKLTEEVDSNERTPLHFAVTLGHDRMIKQLLKYETSAAYRLDKNGFAPIHMAAGNGHISIIKELLRCYPDQKDLLNSKGQNILHIATECGEEKVVFYVLKTKELEGLINEKDNSGNTPLHQATINCYPYIVRILLRDGRVDVTTLNSKMQTALDIAKSLDTNRAKALNITTLLQYASPPWYNPIHVAKEIMYYSSKGKPDDSYKDKANTLLVVATLVATVTFAAGFTLPGGYIGQGQNQGMATLVNLQNFQYFILSDTLAMYSSMGAVISLIWMRTMPSWLSTSELYVIANMLTLVALMFMSLAFTLGINLTVAESKLLSTEILILGFFLYFVVAVFAFPRKVLGNLFLYIYKCCIGFLLWSNFYHLGDKRAVLRTSREHPTHVSMLFSYNN